MIEFSITAIFTAIILLVSLAGFNRPNLVRAYSHYPYYEKRNKQYYRMLTSGFFHGDWMHLLINIYVFWTFGSQVESLFKSTMGELPGSVMYFLLFVVGLIASDLPTYFKHRDNIHYSSIGASGAVSGIVFSMIIFAPWAQYGLYGIIPMPAIIFGVLYLVYSSWASRNSRDHIDHDAHLYGALFGVMFTLFFVPQMAQHFLSELLAVF